MSSLISSRRLIYILAVVLLAINTTACKHEAKNARRKGQTIISDNKDKANSSGNNGSVTDVQEQQDKKADADTAAESEELQEIAITAGRIGNTESQEQGLEEIRVEAQRIEETQNQTVNQEQALEEIAITAERIAEQQEPQLEDIVVSAERIVIADVVTTALAQATGSTIKVDLDKMTESAGQVIIGTSVTMFSLINDPIAQIMLKVNGKDGQARYVVATTNLVGKTAFQERLMQSYLVSGGDRMSLFDFTNKKSIKADELKSQIQISSMCTNNCQQIVLLISVLEDGQVVAGSHSLLAKESGKHKLTVLKTSLGQNAQNFEQGIKTAEVALAANRRLLVVAQAFAKEDSRTELRKQIAQLTTEAQELKQSISVATVTVQKSDESLAQAARASTADSRRSELVQWALTNNSLRIDIHERELRLIEIEKRIKAMETSLAAIK